MHHRSEQYTNSFLATEQLFEHHLATLDIPKKPQNIVITKSFNIWYIIHYQPTYKISFLMQYFTHSFYRCSSALPENTTYNKGFI